MNGPVDPPPAQDRPPELGPDAIAVLDGSTFMVSDGRGDVPEGAVAGLFHDDTRFLSRFELRLGGRTPELLTSSIVDYYSAAFFLANPELQAADGSRVPAHALSVVRSRFVGDGLREGIEVRNHLDRPVSVELRLGCGADFSDIFEVRDRVRAARGTLTRFHDPDHRALGFGYEHGAFRAASRIHSSAPARIEGDDLVFDLHLEPRGTWRTEVRVVVHLDEEIAEPVHEAFGEAVREPGRVLAKWRDEVPRLRADLDLLEHVYRRSIVDLAALRLCAEVEGNEYSLPAAGLPWFMAIFGRDTLITSYQALWVGPDLALGALRALAALQGTVEDDFRDEEPGKILHEIRFGELSALGLKPHRPYYGTADATPLWLILLSEHRRWTGDDRTVRELEPNARRALEWIDRYGDRDGDGYVEYATRSPQGLANQGWKDSWDGVRFADGRLPEPPIAIAEVQGYVYDAKVRAAELAAEVWGDPDLAARLRREAEELRERFSRDFWTDARGGYYAIGLDREKRRIDSMASNMGHLLWSGTVPPPWRGGSSRRRCSPAGGSGRFPRRTPPTTRSATTRARSGPTTTRSPRRGSHATASGRRRTGWRWRCSRRRGSRATGSPRSSRATRGGMHRSRSGTPRRATRKLGRRRRPSCSSAPCWGSRRRARSGATPTCRRRSGACSSTASTRSARTSTSRRRGRPGGSPRPTERPAGPGARRCARYPGRAAPTNEPQSTSLIATTAPVWGASIIRPPPMYSPTWWMGL